MKLVQTQKHVLHSTEILCSYNRLTTKFRLDVDGNPDFECFLGLSLRKSGHIQINNETYEVKIRVSLN